MMERYPMVEDLIPAARRRIPRFAMDFLEHGAGDERLLEKNRRVFDEVVLVPRYMSDFQAPDLSKTLFGKTHALPFGIAPVGLGGLIWPGVEGLNAEAARLNGIPMVLSCVASASLEDMAAAAGDMLWLQLYPPRDEAIRSDLMDRAVKAGIDVLMVTVDVPSPARRERALRSGLSMAPKISPRYLLQAAAHPLWSAGMLRHGMPRFESFRPYLPKGASLQEAAAFVAGQIQRRVTLDEVKAIRAAWPGRLVVKGILHEADAEAVLDAGADGILVSNHGGRQSDAAPPSLTALKTIRAAVGDRVPLFLDSGVRTGLDVLRGLASGADFVFLGRPFFYGAAALGARGPRHVVDILKDELLHSMRQAGMGQDTQLIDIE